MENLDAQLDALLDSDDATNRGNVLAIFSRIHERRRRRAHAKAKSEQPSLGVRGTVQHGSLLATVRAFFRAPLTPQDAASEPGAMDYLLQTLQDNLDANDLEDALFTALRIARKAWAWNQHHLGPIRPE